ncbi:MAG: outer membrane beta-barrel protein [Lewinellaceae bacterium]|nr:outer membrane beta-barrel protein [Lewinellaceae bacterium]
MMKKPVFLIAFLLSAGTLLAQFTAQGNFMMGSTLGFSAATSTITQDKGSGDVATENPTYTQFSIAPSVGYFLIDNLALGIGLDYTFNQVKNKTQATNKDSDLLFGPFARYYIPMTDDMSFFLEANFGFGNSSDDQEVGGVQQNISTNIFAVGVGPGFTIFSSDAIGIETLVKYNYARSDFDTNIGGVRAKTMTRTNQFDFSVGFRFYFTALTKAEGAKPRLY